MFFKEVNAAGQAMVVKRSWISCSKASVVRRPWHKYQTITALEDRISIPQVFDGFLVAIDPVTRAPLPVNLELPGM